MNIWSKIMTYCIAEPNEVKIVPLPVPGPTGPGNLTDYQKYICISFINKIVCYIQK